MSSDRPKVKMTKKTPRSLSVDSPTTSATAVPTSAATAMTAASGSASESTAIV